MATGTDGGSPSVPEVSARDSAVAAVEGAGGSGTHVYAQRQQGRAAPSHWRIHMPANPYTRKRPRAEVPQQPPPVQPQPPPHRHQPWQQPQANHGAAVVGQPPSTRRVGAIANSNAADTRENNQNSGSIAMAAPARTINDMRVHAAMTTAPSSTTVGEFDGQTAAAATSALGRPHNPYAKPSRPPSHAQPQTGQHIMQRAPATQLAQRSADAMPQPRSGPNVGDDSWDGGIDWSAVDFDVATGSRANVSANNDNARSTGNCGREDCESAVVNSAAKPTGATASNLNQGESHQSHQPQKNPYSLASGIGRPTAWSNLQQQQQHQHQVQKGASLKMGGSSVPTVSAAFASASASASSLTTHVAASAATIRPGSSSGSANASGATAAAANISRPSSASTTIASGRAKELPPLPSMIAYDPERVAPIDDGRRAELIRNAELSKALLNGWKILPHQKSGVLRGLKMRRFILAFDMGLGKTLVGCIWGKAFKNTYPDLKIYCICPVSLSKEWIRTASSIVGLDCDDDGKEESPSPELDMHVCSWQKIPSPRKVPEDARHFVVIADEAHQMQNITSGRTKDALALMQDKRCVGVLLLTGTPMKNGKPCNIFPLLRAVRHPFGDNQRLFETFFCNGMQKNFGGRLTWDASGSSNLNHLNAHIAKHMLFMTKEECLENLPPKTREFRKVPVSSRDELKHSNAMNELARLYQSLHSITKDDDSKDRLLGAFNRVRLIASEAKIGATVRLAQATLEKEPAVVIFTNFVAVAKEVHRKLKESGWNGHVLTGETPPKKRQPMVDDFQAGLSAVFVCTFGAGGVGLTLTAASTIILLDRPWTPGDALQAEDRVRRIGQTKAVMSIWIRAFDVDEQIDNLIEEKKQTSLAVVDRKSNYGSPSHTKAAPKISIFQLVNNIINRQSNVETLGGLKKMG